ncbi:MAG TPA: hypothetical protein VGN72_14985 [Tepidisphaeraceae bacterium]|nr:hypothetical protein [Tepidisphaeraceae bacterium]
MLWVLVETAERKVVGYICLRHGTAALGLSDNNSWHGPKCKWGRPTVFVDGHVAVPKKQIYLYGQDILRGNLGDNNNQMTITFSEY